MKAVIMAGGEGTRLRPLTCDMPKPMMPLCGRPVLEYILDLLARSGVTEAAITLKYLPDEIRTHFPGNVYRGIRLDFVVEEEALGTAGSVKNAARDFDEPFLVVSGDALCDYELDKIMKYHKAAGAAATIVVARVEDPREYGLVRFGRENRIESFIEKPGWGQAVCDTANTGIYVLDPACLDLIPDGKSYDFAKDLFPQMMAAGRPLFAYLATGYWCDIGDIPSYIACQRDMLCGRVHCRMTPQISQGIYCVSELPPGDYSIEPPVYIGADVAIDAGAVIGPYTVVGDGCHLGSGAKVRGSILMRGAEISQHAALVDAVAGPGSFVGKGASVFEGGVLGSAAMVRENASVRQNVLVWPRKIIDSGAVLAENCKYGGATLHIFSDNGINPELSFSPEVCVRLGEALASAQAGRRVGIACEGSRASRARKLAVTAGMMMCGSHVWDFGDCFEAQLMFFTSFCNLSAGVFLTDAQGGGLHLFDAGGFPIHRYTERDIEARLRKADYARCSEDRCRDISDMSSVRMMYRQELCRQAGEGLGNLSVRVESASEHVRRVMEECLSRLGCRQERGIRFVLAPSGVTAEAYDESGRKIPWESLLAICCKDRWAAGEDVAIPYSAPGYLDQIASEYGRSAVRYPESPIGEEDRAARELGAHQQWVRDGLFLTVQVLRILAARGCTLAELVDELPSVSVFRREIEAPVSPSGLYELLGDDAGQRLPTGEGIVLRRGAGRVMITPSRTGSRFHVLTESATMEAARELCLDICDLVRKKGAEKQNSVIHDLDSRLESGYNK
ncbi:MAG: sugar phosphate nucleotidyltransferase [Clostridia bacterium]